MPDSSRSRSRPPRGPPRPRPPCPPRPPPRPPRSPPPPPRCCCCCDPGGVGGTGDDCCCCASGAWPSAAGAASGAGVDAAGASVFSVGCAFSSAIVFYSYGDDAFRRPYKDSFSLELQPAFAGRVGQRLDATVVHPPAAVEGDLGDAGGLGLGGDGRADLLGRRDVPAVLQIRAAD